MILIVDDDLAMLELLCEAAEGRGLSVAAATSAEDGMVLLRQLSGIVTLLTDLQMRGLNGRDFAVQARELRPNLRVVFVSAYPAEYLSPEFLADFAASVLKKPFELAALYAALDSDGPSLDDG